MFVRLEEYAQEYDVTALDVLRVVTDHELKLTDVLVVSDTRPEDQNTMDGAVEWMPCVSIYIPKEA